MKGNKSKDETYVLRVNDGPSVLNGPPGILGGVGIPPTLVLVSGPIGLGSTPVVVSTCGAAKVTLRTDSKAINEVVYFILF